MATYIKIGESILLSLFTLYQLSFKLIGRTHRGWDGWWRVRFEFKMIWKGEQ